MTPKGDHTIVVSELRNTKGQKVESIHGGAGRGAFPIDFDPGPFAVIRRTLNTHEQEQLLK